MNDYMKTLCCQFNTASKDELLLAQQINTLHRTLSSQMDKSDRRTLLRLVDLEDSLRNYTALNSFISGYRLAIGIHHELNFLPPYSFDANEERKASPSANKEENHTYENLET